MGTASSRRVWVLSSTQLATKPILIRILQTPRFRRQYRSTAISCQSYLDAVSIDQILPSLSVRPAGPCEGAPNARNLFDTSSIKNRRHNQLLFQYARNEQTFEALNLFLGFLRSGFSIDSSTLSCVLKLCGSSSDQMAGRQLHCLCIKTGFVEDVSVGTALVDMYMKTEDVVDGEKAFDGMVDKNVVSWTSMLAGYSYNELHDRALELFFQMVVEGYQPNPYTYAAIFGSLAHEGAAEKGVEVHAMVVKHGFASNVSVCNSLISMYSKSGMVTDARAVFDRIQNKNVISWNSMIAGYVTNGDDVQAVDMFASMRLSGVKLTRTTFVTAIKLSGNIKELCFTRQLHCWIVKNGESMLSENIVTALLAAYCKCNRMDNALTLFKTMHRFQNVVSWTALINSILEFGSSKQAFDLFLCMRREGIQPNHFTYSTILKVQAAASILQVHAEVIKTNYEKSPLVATALLDAYIKVGNVDEAIKVFQLIELKDIVSWSAMLSGYAQSGETEEAVKIFKQLTERGTEPNEFTFSSIINACSASTASVEQGKQFHASAIKSGSVNTLCVSSALLTMYAKRGNIEDANEVFRRQEERDLVSWNSMICGYAQHGHVRKALEIFEEMKRKDLEMDGITFVGVISACTHAGAVEEGQNYFDMMVKDHHIDPTIEHYSCMVDLYSRSGKLEKAMNIINGMPFSPTATVWRTLLAACRNHSNIDIGEVAAEKLILLQPQHSASYVLLSNMYAATGNWQEREKIRRLMEERKVKKEAGYSWIEVKNKTHTFLAGDMSHTWSEHIYFKLGALNIRLKDVGYQPDTNCVLHDIEDEHKEHVLSQHSEKLAIAFGLIAIPPGIPIQIVKNLRVCHDCHNFMKLTSLIEQRNIIVRDSSRFHHFKGGICTCGDYW